MKGLLQLNELEYFGSKLKAACGEKTHRPSTDCRTRNHRFHKCGSTLEYLIGQQRQQSMPHRAAKSSAKLS